jgi:hypothetical protein
MSVQQTQGQPPSDEEISLLKVKLLKGQVIDNGNPNFKTTIYYTR